MGGGREREVGGRGRGRLRRGTSPQEGNLTQRRGEAESAEREIETTMENERAGDISRRILSPWTSRFGRSSTSAWRKLSINPIDLCALCLSAPLRESKRRRARRQEGDRSHAEARRGRERREWKIDTREPATFQDVSCRHESPAWIACQPHAPLSTQSISALSASPHLCVSQKRRNGRTPDSGVAADASSIWYNAANGRRCKAAARRTPQEWNLTQRRGEAERQRAQRGRLRR